MNDPGRPLHTNELRMLLDLLESIGEGLDDGLAVGRGDLVEPLRHRIEQLWLEQMRMEVGR